MYGQDAMYCSADPSSAKRDLHFAFDMFSSEVETTFALIKPDAVMSGVTLEIIDWLKHEGYFICSRTLEVFVWGKAPKHIRCESCSLRFEVTFKEELRLDDDQAQMFYSSDGELHVNEDHIKHLARSVQASSFLFWQATTFLFLCAVGLLLLWCWRREPPTRLCVMFAAQKILNHS